MFLRCLLSSGVPSRSLPYAGRMWCLHWGERSPLLVTPSFLLAICHEIPKCAPQVRAILQPWADAAAAGRLPADGPPGLRLRVLLAGAAVLPTLAGGWASAAGGLLLNDRPELARHIGQQEGASGGANLEHAFDLHMHARPRTCSYGLILVFALWLHTRSCVSWPCGRAGAGSCGFRPLSPYCVTTSVAEVVDGLVPTGVHILDVTFSDTAAAAAVAAPFDANSSGTSTAASNNNAGAPTAQPSGPAPLEPLLSMLGAKPLSYYVKESTSYEGLKIGEGQPLPPKGQRKRTDKHPVTIRSLRERHQRVQWNFSVNTRSPHGLKRCTPRAPTPSFFPPAPRLQAYPPHATMLPISIVTCAMV